VWYNVGMKCDKCDRDNLTAQELSVHNRYFHKVTGEQEQLVVSGVCPDCGSSLFFQEGCVTCQCCGYSKCG